LEDFIVGAMFEFPSGYCWCCTSYIAFGLRLVGTHLYVDVDLFEFVPKYFRVAGTQFCRVLRRRGADKCKTTLPQQVEMLPIDLARNDDDDVGGDGGEETDQVGCCDQSGLVVQ
jgi:hypothetical protein